MDGETKDVKGSTSSPALTPGSSPERKKTKLRNKKKSVRSTPSPTAVAAGNRPRGGPDPKLITEMRNIMKKYERPTTSSPTTKNRDKDRGRRDDDDDDDDGGCGEESPVVQVGYWGSMNAIPFLKKEAYSVPSSSSGRRHRPKNDDCSNKIHPSTASTQNGSPEPEQCQEEERTQRQDDVKENASAVTTISPTAIAHDQGVIASSSPDEREDPKQENTDGFNDGTDYTDGHDTVKRPTGHSLQIPNDNNVATPSDIGTNGTYCTAAIHFDDGCVVHGRFRGKEKLQRIVHDLKRDVLRNDIHLPDFTICTRDSSNESMNTPTVIDCSKTFYDLGLLPSCDVYFKWDGPFKGHHSDGPGWYLLDDARTING